MDNDENEFGDAFEKEEAVQEESGVAYGSPEWSDYVMSLLTKDEVDPNGRPKCDGLRRIGNQLFDIISSKTLDFSAVRDFAVVNWEIKFLSREVHIIGDDLPIKTVTGLASADEGNTSPPFNKFCAAMADVRAEARAWKRVLLLATTVSEEMPDQDVVETSTADSSSAQRKTVGIMMKNLKIDQEKFLKLHRKDISKSKGPKLVFDNLNKSEVSKALTILNRYQSNNDQEVPKTILA